MFLKSLTLKGFKSFADPASLDLEPGVTVVVGPNGSGKSNVVDAVAWVLGAQGPRTVRSSKMEDVIFAGSADRPALGRAEVSLTIDNRSGRLPGGLAEITITRTLFRSGESEYAINGQPCRLLDIQELLSDSGVGRQQHVIVSQGQLGAILDSRPEDRRAVIEEAAGILKHRRRRERAERRLAATEENLDRLADLQREVKRQIRPLERQAAAARSHASLAEELRALRLFLVGRDLRALDERRAVAADERVRLQGDETTLVATMAELDAAADATAAELATQREDDLVVALTRVQALGERCRGLDGILAERRRSMARALEASADVDVVSTLEADAARLAGELALTDEQEAALAPQAEEVRGAEHALARDLAEHEASFADLAGLRGAEEAFAVARGRLGPLEDALEREQGTLGRAEERVRTTDERRRALRAEDAELGRELDTLSSQVPDLERRAVAARQAEQVAAARLQQAEERQRGAEAHRHRLEARAEAMTRRLAEEDGGAVATEVSALAGVLGTLAEVVEVDDGWSGAFEAAATGALRALVVDGDVTGRTVLAALGERDLAGTVLVASSWEAEPAPSDFDRGWDDIPAGAEPLRRHLHARVPAVGGLLDRLFGTVLAVRGDWDRALDVALARPDAVVVSTEGDRFSALGWVVRAGGRSLVALTRQATAEAERAGAAAAEADAALAGARAEAERAGAEAADGERQLERARDHHRQLTSARQRLAAVVRQADDECADAARHRAAVQERCERDGAQLAQLRLQLPELEAAASAAAGRLAVADEMRRRLEDRRSQVAVLRRELEVKVAGLAERRSVLSTRLADTERRLAGHVEERARAGERRRQLEAAAVATVRLRGVVDGHARRLGVMLTLLQDRRSRQLEDVRAGGARLETLRRERAEAEARLGSARHDLQRLDLELAESGIRREAAEEALRRELGCEPADALDAPRPELDEGVDPARRAAEIDRQLASMGPVNPLALEELGALEERHRFLEEQVEDVRRARRELHQIIRAVDEEIVRVFGQAFADVNEHFQGLVGTLFPGGTGRLELTDPTDLLETGVEV
ncbi:MAG TPA: chromosome segregation protein SMC, partial [Acidimicrobiales bacterium]|nr:chromosome segregation protein SMC [Acidimicrobiales bacterium]